MNSVPKVSVLIPVYNGMPYLQEAVQSVLEQNFNDYELIFSDNLSEDGTWEYIKSLKDPRIRCYRNEKNIGMVANWNKALEYARGKYIKVLPADDYLLPNCLEKQSAILDKHPDVVLVCGAKNVIDSKGKKLFIKRFLRKNTILEGKKAINRVVASGTNSIGEGGSVLFRAEHLSRTGGFENDIFYVEDIQLWFKLLLYGKLYVMTEPVAAFRISGQSLSVQRSGEQLKGFFKFIEKIYSKKEFGLNKRNVIIGKIKNLIFFLIKQSIYFYLKITGR